MKDMFYNYDYNINKKQYPEPICWCDCHKHAIALAGGAIPLTNIKGDVLGLIAKRNSEFKIYFDLEDICGSEMIDQIMENEVICDIINQEHKVLYSPEVLKYSDNILVAEARITDDILPYGSYRVDLYAMINGEKYTLFAPSDGILSID